MRGYKYHKSNNQTAKAQLLKIEFNTPKTPWWKSLLNTLSVLLGLFFAAFSVYLAMDNSNIKTSIQKQDSLISVQHQLLIKQDSSFLQLKNIAIKNDSVNSGLIKINNGTLRLVKSSEDQIIASRYNSRPALVYSDFEFKLDIGEKITDSLSVYNFFFTLKNQGGRQAENIITDVCIWSFVNKGGVYVNSHDTTWGINLNINESQRIVSSQTLENPILKTLENSFITIKSVFLDNNLRLKITTVLTYIIFTDDDKLIYFKYSDPAFIKRLEALEKQGAFRYTK